MCILCQAYRDPPPPSPASKSTTGAAPPGAVPLASEIAKRQVSAPWSPIQTQNVAPFFPLSSLAKAASVEAVAVDGLGAASADAGAGSPSRAKPINALPWASNTASVTSYLKSQDPGSSSPTKVAEACQDGRSQSHYVSLDGLVSPAEQRLLLLLTPAERTAVLSHVEAVVAEVRAIGSAPYAADEPEEDGPGDGTGDNSGATVTESDRVAQQREEAVTAAAGKVVKYRSLQDWKVGCLTSPSLAQLSPYVAVMVAYRCLVNSTAKLPRPNTFRVNGAMILLEAITATFGSRYSGVVSDILNDLKIGLYADWDKARVSHITRRLPLDAPVDTRRPALVGEDAPLRNAPVEGAEAVYHAAAKTWFEIVQERAIREEAIKAKHALVLDKVLRRWDLDTQVTGMERTFSRWRITARQTKQKFLLYRGLTAIQRRAARNTISNPRKLLFNCFHALRIAAATIDLKKQSEQEDARRAARQVGKAESLMKFAQIRHTKLCKEVGKEALILDPPYFQHFFDDELGNSGNASAGFIGRAGVALDLSVTAESSAIVAMHRGHRVNEIAVRWFRDSATRCKMALAMSEQKISYTNIGIDAKTWDGIDVSTKQDEELRSFSPAALEVPFLNDPENWLYCIHWLAPSLCPPPSAFPSDRLEDKLSLANIVAHFATQYIKATMPSFKVPLSGRDILTASSVELAPILSVLRHVESIKNLETLSISIAPSVVKSNDDSLAVNVESSFNNAASSSISVDVVTPTTSAVVSFSREQEESGDVDDGDVGASGTNSMALAVVQAENKMVDELAADEPMVSPKPIKDHDSDCSEDTVDDVEIDIAEEAAIVTAASAPAGERRMSGTQERAAVVVASTLGYSEDPVVTRKKIRIFSNILFVRIVDVLSSQSVTEHYKEWKCLRQIAWKYGLALRRIYQYYSALNPSSATLSMGEFLSLLADCRITQGKKIPRTTLQSIYMKSSVSNETAITDAISMFNRFSPALKSTLSSMQPAIAAIAVEGRPSTLDLRIEKIKGTSYDSDEESDDDSWNGKVNLQHPTQNQELLPTYFIEALIRLSVDSRVVVATQTVEKDGAAPQTVQLKPSDRFEVLIQEVLLPFAVQSDIDRFLVASSTPEIQFVLKGYEASLSKIFDFYATKTASSKLASLSAAEAAAPAPRMQRSVSTSRFTLGRSRSGLSLPSTVKLGKAPPIKKVSAEDDPTVLGEPEINLETFLSMCSDAHLLSTELNPSLITTTVASLIFSNVQFDPDPRMCIEEFHKAVVCLACFRNPTPWIFLGHRLNAFLVSVFLPALANKVGFIRPSAVMYTVSVMAEHTNTSSVPSAAKTGDAPAESPKTAETAAHDSAPKEDPPNMSVTAHASTAVSSPLPEKPVPPRPTAEGRGRPGLSRVLSAASMELGSPAITLDS